MTKTKLTIPHYHHMNGSIGCIPDTNNVYNSRRGALESAYSLFDELTRAQKAELKRYGILYFERPSDWGADYVEIVTCRDNTCTCDFD